MSHIQPHIDTSFFSAVFLIRTGIRRVGINTQHFNDDEKSINRHKNTPYFFE